MIEKIKRVSNPLTIIAIFAGLTEISGTIVLPFVSEINQATFVWFLILFPTLLVICFYLTLNFNHKVLYAPSDYRSDESFSDALKKDKSEFEIELNTIKEESKKFITNPSEEKFIDSASNATTSPKMVIQDSWNALESSAKESLGFDYNHSFELEHALRQFTLPEDKFKLFSQLKDLKSKAISIPEQAIATSTALDYAKATYNLSRYLQDLKKST